MPEQPAAQPAPVTDADVRAAIAAGAAISNDIAYRFILRLLADREAAMEIIEGLLADYDLIEGAFSDILSFAHTHGYKYRGEKVKGYPDKAAALVAAVKGEE